ncbi:MAG: hypothetical protein ABMA25_16640 [Ilumatobacteraceae bacterium]
MPPVTERDLHMRSRVVREAVSLKLLFADGERLVCAGTRTTTTERRETKGIVVFGSSSLEIRLGSPLPVDRLGASVEVAIDDGPAIRMSVIPDLHSLRRW